MSLSHSCTNARLELASLVLFRGVLSDPVVEAFVKMLDSCGSESVKSVDSYAGFVSRLYEHGGDWSSYLLERVLCDENPYMQLTGAGEDIPLYLEQALTRELRLLQSVAEITPADVAKAAEISVELPLWSVSEQDFDGSFRRRLQSVGKTGYGIFCHNHMFLFRDGGLVAVRHPDSVRLDNLTGYENERQRVIANTKALLEGRPAANILLYGDSGTGKSTCVKAVANELKDDGLRLIELQKGDLSHIPVLIDRLSKNPLKFIIFIDDLSFSNNSDIFSDMKAILEGSVSAKTSNIVIYATSNRRHLVRENFADRVGDEIHLRDTIEETSSLSDRFGLLITFMRPDKDLYLSIAQRYCEKFGVEFDAIKAEAFALRRGGRSARAAKQFAESIASEREE